MTERRLSTVVAPWLARGPAPGLRRPRLLAVGGADDALLRVAQELGIGVWAGPTPAPNLPVAEALEWGAAAVDAEVDAGTDLLLVAVGPGADDAAAAALAALSGVEPVAVVGFDFPGAPGESADSWGERVVAVRDGLRAIAAEAHSAAEILTGLADGPAGIGEHTAALAVAVGMVRAGAGRRTPMLLDGLPAMVAALLAARDDAEVRSWLLLAAAPVSTPEKLAAGRLGVTWLLDMGTDSPAGLAGVLAVPVLIGLRALAGP